MLLQLGLKRHLTAVCTFNMIFLKKIWQNFLTGKHKSGLFPIYLYTFALPANSGR